MSNFWGSLHLSVTADAGFLMERRYEYAGGKQQYGMDAKEAANKSYQAKKRGLRLPKSGLWDVYEGTS